MLKNNKLDVLTSSFIKYKANNCSFQQLLQHSLICFLFYLNTRKAMSLRAFILKPTKTAYVLLKNSTRHFRHWRFFIWQSLEILKQIFWKMKTFFAKLEYRLYLKYYNWKRNVSIQNCPLRSQCYHK